MAIRSKPISRGNYRWKPKAKPEKSLRYTTILNGAVRVYPDGREVCQENTAGKKEYDRRIEVMWRRQSFKCCLCNKLIFGSSNATFEHIDLRGLGGATRDDRIVDDDTNWMNGAAHWGCNGEKGSKRL